MLSLGRAVAPFWENDTVQAVIDRVLSLRDRMYASARFQSAAASFYPTRLIARRRAYDLFDICAGFVYSQILAACVELGIFGILREAPLDLPSLARRCGLPIDAAQRLADAAVALRLLEKRSKGRYGLGALGAAVAGNPGVAAMVGHHRHLYADLLDPVSLLRRSAKPTELGKYWPYAATRQPSDLSSEEVAGYSALMASSQPIVADEVLDAYPLQRCRCLLDVGGGEGTFLAEAAARFPHLQLMLFDIPAVIERAKVQLERRGLGPRSKIFGGDFFSDPLPKGADVISLIRIALDHDDQKVLTLLRSAHAALGAGGVLLIAEPLPDMGHEPMASAYFGFYLMAMGRGRVRTREEFTNLLIEAGFKNVRFCKGRRVLQTGVVIATA
ncbi:methyltransferase [Hyphomicrobium sp. ghe19]|uniref:methyltransferase n=1 Tax=Hyphomicrobium sp. ghe19 TaxID=2682968 RepID=UPI001366E53C|nr:Demethylspheroidene O-methyltransferase [Hyphomicrobium sp. ghe19]